MFRRLTTATTTASSSAAAVIVAAAAPHPFISQRHGQTQLQDMPTSSTRKPGGMHRGPGKRQVATWEASWWRYVKRWEHEMEGDWDSLERFQHLPKPKRLLGNEACEIVWPYSVLLENVIKIHPFTKSVYVYYPQHTLTDAGANAALLARRFARECLVPICFHNSQCYVETESLLEHSDTAWVVVHCLDGRHEIVRVDDFEKQTDKKNKAKATMTQDEQKLALLTRVLETATALGTSVKNPADLMLQLNERPLQNAFIRVDYQWMGDTPEERQAHLVRWIDPDDRGTQPMMYGRDMILADWLNTTDNRPLDPRMAVNEFKDRRKAYRGSQRASSLSGYFERYSRVSSTWSRSVGKDGRAGV